MIHEQLNWPLVWIAIGLTVGTFAALYAMYPRRADERTRSNEQQ